MQIWFICYQHTPFLLYKKAGKTAIRYELEAQKQQQNFKTAVSLKEGLEMGL